MPEISHAVCEGWAIVSQSLNIHERAVRDSIGAKRYSYENAVPYVYELIVSK